MRIHSSLKNFLAFNFLIAAVLPILIVGLLVLRLLSEHIEDDVTRTNLLLAQSLSGEVRRFLREPLSLLAQVGDTTGQKGYIKDGQINAYLETAIKHHSYFESIQLVDSRGIIRFIAPFDQNQLGIDLSGQPFFRQTVKTQKPFFSDVFISLRTGQPTLTVTSPHTGGIVAGYLNLQALNTITNRVRIGGFGHAAILDEHGTVIAHPDRSVVLQQSNYLDTGRIRESQRKSEGIMQYTFKGEKRIASFSTVPQTGWLVIVSQPEEEAFALVRATRLMFWAGIAFTVALTAGLIFLRLKKILKPFSQLVAGAQKIAEGDYNYEFQPTGYSEIDTLTGNFHTMQEAVRVREEALRNAEEQYRNIFENAVEGIFQSTPEGRYITVNPTLARMTGYGSPREMVEAVTNIAQQLYANPEERNRFREVLETQGLVENFEVHLRRKDGSLFWASLNSRAVKNDDGIIHYYEGSVKDITDRMKSEEVLRESEERFRRVTDLTGQLIYDWDIPAGRITRAGRTEQIIGYTIESHGPFWWEERVHPEDRARVTALLRQTMENRQPFVCEYRFRRADGTYIELEDSGAFIYTDSGEAIRMVGVMKDITEHKKAEAALRASEEKYRFILNNMNDVVWQMTPDLRFTFISPAVEHLLGYKPEEIIQRPFVEFLTPVSLAFVKETVFARQQHARQGIRLDTIAFECELVCKDGRVIAVDIQSTPVYGADGRLAGFQGMGRDITERKRLESQLQQSQKMEAIGTLAGGIAHDFNNILTTLMGYSSLLQMRLDKTDPLRSYVDQILSASQKGAGLTQSLLAFSRRQPATLTPLNVNDIIAGTQKLLARLLIEDIELKTFLTSGELVIMADATQMDQILFNLVVNARDAMPKGGTLTISTDVTEMDTEFIHSHGFGTPGRYVKISISDTGMGMDKVTQAKIFDPFFTTKEVGKGTGLGLATVYGIVSQNGGYINVYSELGEGTTFHVYLPLTAFRTAEEKLASHPPLKGHETILIAEDNEEVRQLMRDTLIQYGYKTIEAFDGQDAVDKFKQFQNLDLVIIDSVMPKKNGREVYEEIRTIRPSMRVLFTSGYTKDVILDRGIEDREFDFISKPMSPVSLLKKIREILDR
jgi:two-component system cell cycle sensor histidine kinase/response regulator CckA